MMLTPLPKRLITTQMTTALSEMKEIADRAMLKDE